MSISGGIWDKATKKFTLDGPLRDHHHDAVSSGIRTALHATDQHLQCRMWFLSMYRKGIPTYHLFDRPPYTVELLPESDYYRDHCDNTPLPSHPHKELSRLSIKDTHLRSDAEDDDDIASVATADPSGHRADQIDPNSGLPHDPTNAGDSEHDQTGSLTAAYHTRVIEGKTYTIDRSRAHAGSHGIAQGVDREQKRRLDSVLWLCRDRLEGCAVRRAHQ